MKLKIMMFSLLVSWVCGQSVNTTVSEAVQVTYHLNPSHAAAVDASDAGTLDRPFKTLTYAMQQAFQNITATTEISTKILLYPGIYRESSSLDFYHSNPDRYRAALVLEAKEAGKAVISGAEMWTSGWTLSDSRQNLFWHPWAMSWGLASNPYTDAQGNPIPMSDLVRRREWVVVGGVVFRQVESKEAMTYGTFFVDESAARLYVRPHPGISFPLVGVEVGQRDFLLTIKNKKNLVIRGVVFQHATNPIPASAVTLNRCQNLLVENCQFRENNWTGLSTDGSVSAPGKNIQIRNCRMERNGGNGFGASGAYDLCVQDCGVYENNLRGAWGGYLGWSQAGGKFMNLRRATFLRVAAEQNQAYGLWFDTDCRSLLVDDSRLGDNWLTGLLLEANPGPIEVKNSSLFGSKYEDGLTVMVSQNIKITGCRFVDNTDTQFVVTGKGGTSTPSRNIIDFETGATVTVRSQSIEWSGNTMVAKQPFQRLVDHFGTDLGTCTGGGNTYFNSSLTSVFRLGSTTYDLSGWKGKLSSEASSAWTLPGWSTPQVSLMVPTLVAVGVQVSVTGTVQGTDLEEVLFYDGEQFLGRDTVAPYAWSWNPTPGAHSISARARDRRGQWSEISTKPLTVGNVVATTADLTAPSNGSSFPQGSQISVTANCRSAGAGGVDWVDFYAGTQWLGSDAWYGPYGVNWNPAAGTYQVKAVARDSFGITTSSSTRTVTITPPSGTTVLVNESFDVGTMGSAVVNAPAPASMGLSGESYTTGNSSMKIVDRKLGSAEHRPLIYWDFSPVVGKKIRISFDYRNATPGLDPNVYVQARDGAGNTTRASLLLKRATKQYATEDFAVVDDYSDLLTDGDWHHVVMEVPSWGMSASSYQVTIDGNSFQIPLSTENGNGISRLVIRDEGEIDDTVYFDQVRVEVLP